MKRKIILSTLCFLLIGLVLSSKKEVQVKAVSDSWSKAYQFQTSTSFRAHLGILNDKIYLLAKDSYQEDDNKGGTINVFTSDGDDWQQEGNFSSCLARGGKEAIAIGNFSELTSANNKLYFGTYPRTALMSYDGSECRTIFSFDWGGDPNVGSTWQTASRGIFYKGKIYFVSHQLTKEGDENTEKSQLRTFDVNAGDYPTVEKISDSYPKADGRDPSQGPLAVLKDRLYFTHGVFRQGGYLGVSTGGGDSKVSGSPSYNPTAGVADETLGKLYFGGWNEGTNRTGIYSYDGGSFKELKTMSGRFRPSAMAIFNNKLFVAGREPGSKPLLVFNLGNDGSASFSGENGDAAYEVTDLKVYKEKLYALASSKSNPGDGEVWVLGETGSGPTAPPQPGIKGDLNGDGKVDLRDIAIYFLYKNVPLLGRTVAADLNNDGVVDSQDFKILQANM